MLFWLIEQIFSEIQEPVPTATAKKQGFVRPPQVPPLKLWEIPRSESLETIPAAPELSPGSGYMQLLDVASLQPGLSVHQEQYVGELTELFARFGQEWTKRWE